MSGQVLVHFSYAKCISRNILLLPPRRPPPMLGHESRPRRAFQKIVTTTLEGERWGGGPLKHVSFIGAGQTAAKAAAALQILSICADLEVEPEIFQQLAS